MELQQYQQQLSHWLEQQRDTDSAPPDGIRGIRGLDAKRCATIYRDSIRGSRLRALQISFPVCQQLVGDDCFHASCRHFVDHCQADIREFSDLNRHFVDFIGHFAPLQQLPYLADMARLEADFEQVIEAPCNPDTATDLSQLAAEKGMEVGLCLSEPAALFDSDFAVIDVWQAHRDNPVSDFDNIQLPTPQRGIIWRHQAHTFIASISANQWQLLNFLQSRQTLLQTIEQLSGQLDEAVDALIIDAWQQGWLKAS